MSRLLLRVQPSDTAVSVEDPGLLDAYGSFLNNDRSCLVELGEDTEYTVAENLLWSPRKLRVACGGAGASGVMFCYKKGKEFGDDLDLVVYEHQKPAWRCMGV